MRLNTYNNLEEFYEQYNYDRDILNGHFTGIEFEYNFRVYRLSKDYSNESEERLKYWTYEVIDYDTQFPSFIELNKYVNLDAVLNEWTIEGKKFKDIIMDDNTIILAQD